MEESFVKYFQINSSDLVYLKFILEAYEGFATLSTEDRQNGIIRLVVPAAFHDEVNNLLDGLRSEIEFMEVLKSPLDNDSFGGWIRREHGHA